MALKQSVANQLINKLLRNTDFTSPTAVYCSLHSADPGDTGASEITGYTGNRKQVTFSAPASGATSNSGDLTFASMPAVTVTHAGLWDAATGGNFLGSKALTANKVVGSGDTFTIATGDFDVTVT